MLKTKTSVLTLTAICTAFLAICSQISIPIGQVPINLALLAVFICGGLLPFRHAVLSGVAYLLLGCVGIPVFAGFSAGIGILLGPTGGYLLSYPIVAGITSLQCFKGSKWRTLTGMVLGLVVCYLLGTWYFQYSTNIQFVESLFICVIPFIIPDCIKAVCATFIVDKCLKHL